MNDPMYTRFCAPGTTMASAGSSSASRWGALGITTTGLFVSRTRANSAAEVSLTVATTSAAFSVSRCGRYERWNSRQPSRTNHGRSRGGVRWR